MGVSNKEVMPAMGWLLSPINSLTWVHVNISQSTHTWPHVENYQKNRWRGTSTYANTPYHLRIILHFVLVANYHPRSLESESINWALKCFCCVY